MSEWLAVEAIVRQRDKEVMAANLVKLSSESTSGEAPPPIIMQDLANDVSIIEILVLVTSKNFIGCYLLLKLLSPGLKAIFLSLFCLILLLFSEIFSLLE